MRFTYNHDTDEGTFTVEYLNLGNNFTFDHVLNAIREDSDLWQYITSELYQTYTEAEITLKAQINFGNTYEGTFIASELYENLS